jgi:DNA-binding phage protein
MAITLGSKSKSTRKPVTRPAAKRSAPAKSKPAAGRRTASTARASTAKGRTAAKPDTTIKRGGKTAPKSTKATPARATRSSKLDQAQLEQWIENLTEAGDELTEARKAHEAASAQVHKIAAKAQKAGVPMKLVAETLGVSRQYLYKGLVDNGNGSGRSTNGSKPAAKRTTKPAAKAPAKRTTAKRTASKAKPAAKRTVSTKTTARKTATRPKIRAGR